MMLRRLLLLIFIYPGLIFSSGSLRGEETANLDKQVNNAYNHQVDDSQGQQVVSIHGMAMDYAGKMLSFYTYREPVSRQQTKLATTTIGPDGFFKITFPAPLTIEVYADLEKFRGTLVVESGANYEIILPPFSPRTVQEAASPYFEPQLYWLGIKETKPTEINFLVRAFLTEYNRELSVHTMDIYQRKSVDTAKAIIGRLEKSFPAGKDVYLNLLKLYSFAELEFATAQTDKDQVIQKYFASREIALAHSAYQRLFSTLFSDFLMIKSQDIRQKNLYIPAYRGDFIGFVNILKKEGYHQDIAELVAVKCFYDGYYSGKFSKKLMIKGIKDALDQTESQKLKEVLPAIIVKIDQLQEGSPAPALQLRNQENVKASLSSKGKFVYLVFFRGDSKACRAELDSLVAIHKKLNTILTVVPVSLDQNFSTATKLWAEKKYPWNLVTTTDPEKTRSDFEIKSLPAFYLISPDMRLLLSPALAPSHDFEGLFLRIYRKNGR